MHSIIYIEPIPWALGNNGDKTGSLPLPASLSKKSILEFIKEVKYLIVACIATIRTLHLT